MNDLPYSAVVVQAHLRLRADEVIPRQFMRDK